MRILVYGLQSSGASLFTFFLSQMPEYYSLCDIYNSGPCPEIPDDINIVVKVTASPVTTYSDYLKMVNPDKSILILRNPFDNYASLKIKRYAGNLTEKFREIERVFTKNAFSLIIKYEDFVFTPEKVIPRLNKISINVSSDMLSFPRTREEITKYTSQIKQFRKGNIHKHFGNIQEIESRGICKDKVRKDHSDINKNMIRSICPTLCSIYE